MLLPKPKMHEKNPTFDDLAETRPERVGPEERTAALLAELPPADAEIVREIVETAWKFARTPISRLDRKIANTALREMLRAFRLFAPYQGVRKVSIFGSARIAPGDAEYELARDFAALITQRGWMVITGAGPGIMQAGNEGAGEGRSFGVNIRLPFEAEPNPAIAEDEKLINFKYFFTRKLTFIKESDAFVLFPGGFGTLDETLELLTLVQTGKSDIHPIVLLEPAGGSYWDQFESYLRNELLGSGYIRADDLLLYRRAQSAAEAVDEIEGFYRVYHSQRFVGTNLVIRLSILPDPDLLASLSDEFKDMLDGPIVAVKASRGEIADDDFVDLPRISVPFDRERAGRLRILIDRLNQSAHP